MVAWAQLLIGIGTMLGAITGSALAVYSVIRARREPRHAAERAADHLLHPNPDDEVALAAALEILLHHQHQHSHPAEGHHVPPGQHEHHHGEGGVQ